MLPLTRQVLSMAAHKSLPAIFGRIHPKYLTPFWGTVILSALSILWYVLVTVWNANAIWDAISSPTSIPTAPQRIEAQMKRRTLSSS